MTVDVNGFACFAFAVCFFLAAIWGGMPSISPLVTQLRRIADAFEESNQLEKERARREVLNRPPAR